MCLFEQIYKYLKDIFGNPRCELVYNSPFELLVCVILSAQCTDKRVNQCTKELFKHANTPYQFAQMEITTLEKLIYSCGFYHNKAKAIINMSKQLIRDYNGEVPNNIQDLQKLSGVGRKTANVVFATAFNGDAIAVDTHVFRVSNRIGLANSTNVNVTEKQLMKVVPQNYWSEFHYLLVLFGRYFCTARKPNCENCKLKDCCKYYNNKSSINCNTKRR